MSAIIEVYHAGVDHVRKPDTKHGRSQLDFGPNQILIDKYLSFTDSIIIEKP